MNPENVTFTAMGARGDGIGMADGHRVHVPFVLPGETARITREGERGTLLDIVEASPDRVLPPCPHFTRCGGCAVQHWAGERIAEWKRERVATALRRAKIAAQVLPARVAHGAGRRRVTLHVRYPKAPGGRIEAGFMQARSHALVDLDSCPLLVPALAPAPEIARGIGHILRGVAKPLDVQVTACDAGIDCDIRGSGPLVDGLRQKLIAFARERDLARLSLHGERLIEARVPVLTFDGLTAYLPPGSFLQATAEAEATLAGFAVEALKDTRHVADLFCGLGPFALRLARHVKVSAIDSDKGAIEALSRSIRANPGGKPLVAEARDLFRRPFFAPDLKPFDAVLMDPPRQGAEAQARELAKSKVAKVVSISCDPESFARDARILVDGGFRLEPVTPVDQFRYSAHVEVMAVFAR
ncbi:MAG: class I SAM-dependent RNA methyltransferase [Methylobacterium sp.]|nr:class I SAM-dependent RNA methyltransferase [Methylobacterium sp.]MCA3600532.1 class I SAM-dependent RNA methyltransferase [Methylobacterium sp.]MCA3607748.1 class I SAM-dependent RNA methyltransferase [Methylobacterium sp.]MCA3609195.1 class I SAM-dependent RNA methyltransferase [Methylobacterium sp.]MCA3618976.1 class I SAM-dependent RNA methyltransferase [Methylobacterium sp.]